MFLQNLKSSKAFKIFVSIILLFGFFLTNTQEDLTQPVDDLPTHFAFINPKQITCMAKNIYYEANGESVQGQAAIARVVLNRVAHGFGSTPCSVIYQTTTTATAKVCQFSWVCDSTVSLSKTSAAYQRAEKIAYEVLANDAYKDVVPKSTLFFHNIHVDPAWPYKQVAKVGNHIFYSKAKKKHD